MPHMAVVPKTIGSPPNLPAVMSKRMKDGAGVSTPICPTPKRVICKYEKIPIKNTVMER